MTTLNNENVSVGDRVYDLTQGHGVVVDTTFNEIAVRFKSGIRISFDRTGHYGGVRRLYWHNPVIVDPPRDESRWKVLADCIKPLYDYLC